MNTKQLALLTFVFLLIAAGSLQAQKGPSNYKQYNHKVIAILPFKTNSYGKRAMRKDTTVDQSLEREAKFALQVQQAMCNAFMRDSANLTVKVQDWRVTDSLLQAAGVSLRKANYMDQHAIADLLKVDAVISGSLSAVMTRTMSPATGYAVGVIGPDYNNYDRETTLFVNLYDGESGDVIWQFDDTVQTFLLTSQKTADNRLYKRLLKRVPYHL